MARRVRFWSLRSRILLLVLLAVLPTVSLMVHLAWHQRRALVDETATQASRLARLFAADQEQAVDGARQLLRALSRLPALGGDDRAACSRLLAEVLAESLNYGAFAYVDLDGSVRCSSRAGPPGVTVADRDYFRRALVADGFVVGEMTVGRINPRAALPFARLVTDAAGRPQGVVVVSVSLDRLGALVDETELPAAATLAVIDERGTVLARYPYDAAAIGRLAPWAAGAGAGAGGAGPGDSPSLLDLGGEVVGLAPVGRSGLAIGVALPKRAAIAAGDRLFALYLGAIAATTALALALAWAVGETTIGRRVRALTRAAAALRAGDLAARAHLPPGGGGELQELGDAFDHMAAELERRERELREKGEAFRRQALHDALTGLPNRVLFRDRLERHVAAADRRDTHVAVLALDLDHFKEVNDTLGHDAGDRLLVAAAERLRGCVRDCDTVARLGGDEFAVVLGEAGRAADAAVVAERIAAALAKPFDLGGHPVRVGASIGVTVFPTDAADVGQLLKCADLALYRAKEAGRGTYCFYASNLKARVERRKAVEDQLRLAVDRDELLLHYQPEVELRTGRIVGVEALLRWRHPEAGLTGPDLFLPVVGATDLVLAVGDWVLRTACAQLAAWDAAGLPPLRMAVNAAPAQLRRRDLPAAVSGVLGATGLSPDRLVLEVTENVVLDGAGGDVAHVLRRLHRMGVGLAWDDFGTGYSSLVHLKKLPVGYVKIDRSFVRNLGGGRDRDDAAIVRGTVGLARSLGRTVIAEGVETAAQAALLAEFGCDQAQGYYYGRPMPADELEAVVRGPRRVAA